MTPEDDHRFRRIAIGVMSDDGDGSTQLAMYKRDACWHIEMRDLSVSVDRATLLWFAETIAKTIRDEQREEEMRSS